MATNYNLMSNAQLKEEYTRIENEYKVKQQDLKQAYDAMVRLSNEFSTISEIIDKREGRTSKNNEQNENE